MIWNCKNKKVFKVRVVYPEVSGVACVPKGTIIEVFKSDSRFYISTDESLSDYSRLVYVMNTELLPNKNVIGGELV